MKKYLPYILILLAMIGMFDAGYLTYEHYAKIIPPCSTAIPFADCGKVLNSQYSVIFGIPLAILGAIHYFILTIVLVYAGVGKRRFARFWALIQETGGFLFSLYLVFLQLFVLHAICLYCMLSALTSTVLLFFIVFGFTKERKLLQTIIFGFLYRNIFKKILFQFDPEHVHVFITRMSEFVGRIWLGRVFSSFLFNYDDSALEQTIAGITFKKPVGLAAGFDYEAQLAQILPNAGFGFQSVGTITYSAYGGNPRPMLGRLPKSQSLMVNKGFKNLGAKVTAEKLAKKKFTTPVGVSIGRTNTKERLNQKQSVEEICKAFMIFEKSKVKNAYYELNISCPNLYGDISFYPPKNLEELLVAVDKLKLKKPVFVKMPIELSDKETLAILKIIAKHSPVGVIIGNLQKDRKNTAFNKQEVKKFPVGNFSGKPTFERSNELIKLAYKHFKKDLIIIGCGGIFSAEDAYKKITLGASMVQLITGMIFVGPQLVTSINIGLLDLLEKDGFKNISEAIGSKNK